MHKVSNAEPTGQTTALERSDWPTGQTGVSDRSDRSSADSQQQRIGHYRTRTNDMCEAIEDFGDIDKLGQCFTSVDALEKVDI